MNAKQRRKHAKAFLADLSKFNDDEKIQGLLDAANDLRKQENKLEQLRQRVAELEKERNIASMISDNCRSELEEFRQYAIALEAERDAALARCEHIEMTIEPYLIDRDRMAGEIVTLKSALREALPIVKDWVHDNAGAGYEAIATINAALGETK